MLWKTLYKVMNKSLDWTSVFLMGLLVTDVVWQVISRYILKTPSAWTEETAGFLMIWVGMLGAAAALRRKAHLGIDFYVEKFPRKTREAVRVIVHFLILFFSLGILTIGGFQFVRNTFATGQVSPALGIEMGYIYLAVPISGIFMSIYCLRQAYEHYSELFGDQ